MNFSFHRKLASAVALVAPLFQPASPSQWVTWLVQLHAASVSQHLGSFPSIDMSEYPDGPSSAGWYVTLKMLFVYFVAKTPWS